MERTEADILSLYIAVINLDRSLGPENIEAQKALGTSFKKFSQAYIL